MWPFRSHRIGCLNRMEQAHHQLQEALDRLTRSTTALVNRHQPKVRLIKIEAHRDSAQMRRR